MASVERPELPARRNPELENAPQHAILVEKRCLGQTELKVKPGQVGTVNATLPENLGKLDYAHLRVPLPKDLAGSGIFPKQKDRQYPEAYFLMRRSSDGYVSASGMFKAAFPYASTAEESTEKEYFKDALKHSSHEVAGNIWIDAESAVTLAEEYGITPWVAALLDPEEIAHGVKERHIKSPPPFKGKVLTNGAAKSPSEKKKSTRGRAARAESPTTTTKQARKIATPRKRKTKAAKADDDAASVAGTESINGDVVNSDSKPTDTVKVEIETTTDPDDETETTKVNIEMPANSPLLELPTNAEDMLEKAREMVAEAEKLSGPSSGKGKRKAKDDLLDDEEPVPAKKAKVEIEAKKTQIKRRAITGIAASLAVGALIPTIMTFLPFS